MLVFIRKLLLFLLPFLLLLALYAYLDPFKVIKHYDSYFAHDLPNYVYINKEHGTVENFKARYPQQHYDSYILGSSRSFNFRVADWRQYINSDKIYHFDASKESLFGIAGKLAFLQKRNAPIKHALIIVDATLLKQAENEKGHLFIKHPEISGESAISYYFEYVKAFFSFDFLYDYTIWKLTGKAGKTLDSKALHYDEITNELLQKSLEDELKKDSVGYYTRRNNLFYTRKNAPIIANAVLQEKHKALLQQIKNILTEQHTDYKIIISPLYNQEQLNPADIACLQQIFGKEHIFDFSGKNKITDYVGNYYEFSHYKPFVAAQVMAIAYGNGQIK